MLRFSKSLSVPHVYRGIHCTTSSLQCVPMSKFDPETDVRENFAKLQNNIDIVKSKLRRPLTLSEKIVYGHLDEPETADIVRGMHVIIK